MLRGDLDRIVLMCLRNERENRYAGVRELSDDILAYLENRPVAATPPSLAYVASRTLRRHRLAAALGLVLAIIAVAVFVRVDAERRTANAAGIVIAAAQDKVDSNRQRVDEARLAEKAARASAVARVEAFERMADVKRLADRLREAEEELWPARPAKVEAMRAWVRKSETMLGRVPHHRAQLEILHATPRPPTSRPEEEQALADDQSRWMIDTLVTLIAGLDAFGAAGGVLDRVKQRLERALTVEDETITRHASDWADAIASIQDREACPQYDGLVIPPQLGLVPIGRDAQSGLWEFGLWGPAGEVPRRDSKGRIRITEDSGMVLVLIPGGSYTIGSPSGEAGRSPVEGPRHEIELAPFFLSKYEVTQAQWKRLTGTNPSFFGPDRYEAAWDRLPADAKTLTLHPVEMVDWYESDRWLRRSGLLLPTEAQWEYATRAGTTTTWWTGDDIQSLQGAENLLDSYYRRVGGDHAGWAYEDALDDGFVMHAPVGSLRANGFGLHDMGGNVREWCRDTIAGYHVSVAAGDGERVIPADLPNPHAKVIRGGCYVMPASHARSAHRVQRWAEYRVEHTGVRAARAIERP